MVHAPLPPAARIRRSDEFRTVFSRGKRYLRSGLVVIATPGACREARLGLAVAKRRVPRAVDRNRVKRIIRESFRHSRGRLGAVDVVVLARDGTAGMSNRQLSGQLHGIWAEIAGQ